MRNDSLQTKRRLTRATGFINLNQYHLQLSCKFFGPFGIDLFLRLPGWEGLSARCLICLASSTNRSLSFQATPGNFFVVLFSDYWRCLMARP